MPIGGLRLTAIPLPEPHPGYVRVRLRTASLNHRELQILEGTRREWGTHTLGSDGAGVIDKLGAGVDSVRLGDRVVINPGLGWGDGERAPLPTFNTLGGPSDGTFAEAVTVPAENVFRFPSHLSWGEAAALPVASQTAYRALIVRAALETSETILIHGIGGGVAQAALAIAQAIGAKAIVTSSDDAKLARAASQGAKWGINYRRDDWQKQVGLLTDGAGPDVILDSVGGATLAAGITAVRRGGRVVSLGLTTGPAEFFPIRPLYVRHVDLLGTTLGSPRDFRRMLDLYDRYQLHPVIDSEFPLERIGTAMSRLASGEQYGKIVLNISDG
jgi:NADPH:quinone reductase-like Zn-dependent oxidoreductase